MYSKVACGNAYYFGSGFHSLPTGKCIQRATSFAPTNFYAAFPFPSNGKVYSKSGAWKARSIKSKWLSFHSLPTGKCIQSQSVGRIRNCDPKFPFPSNGKVYSKGTRHIERDGEEWKSFHSLPTGKCIQRRQFIR